MIRALLAVSFDLWVIASAQTTSLRDELRGFPRAAWVLFLGTFLNKFGTFVLPFLAIYLTRLGYTEAQAGIAIGAYGLGTLCASFTGGHLADTIGRRKTIVLSMFSVAVVMIVLSQARQLPTIILLSALAGFTGEMYRPASSALLTDLIRPEQRLTAFAAYRMALNAGWSFGPAVAGLLAKKSFVWLFIGDAATSVLYGLVAWFALPPGLMKTRSGDSLKATWRVLRHDASFRRVLFSAFLVGLVFLQLFSTMSIATTQAGFAPATYGALVSLNGVLVVIGELPMTRFTVRHRPTTMMALGFMLIGAGFALNILPHTVPLLVTSVVVFTIGEMLSMPVGQSYVANLSPENERGLYMGAYGLTWSLAFIIGPSLGMALYGANPAVLWVACGVLGVLAALIILGARSAIPRNADEARRSRHKRCQT